MCDIFKDCRKAFHEKRDKNRSQINELVESCLVRNSSFIKTNMLHAAMKIIWAQKWKLFPVRKEREKMCFRWSPFMIDYISAYKSQMAFMGLDFKSDKPRMKAEL